MSRIGYQFIWERTCGFPLSVLDNEKWVVSVAIVASLRIEDWRIVVRFPARVKTLSVVQNSKPSPSLTSYSVQREERIVSPRIKRLGREMINYSYPVQQLRNYSLPHNFKPCTETPLDLTRIKCGRNKDKERARRRWSARLKGVCI